MIKLVNLPSFDVALKYATDFCRDKLTTNATIIVPDKLSLFMEKHLFESLNLQASFCIKVSTLDRFVKKDVDLDKSKTLSKLGCVVLVHKILTENFDKLQLLRNKAYSFSYAEEIFNTIAQLKASKIGYEEMCKFASNNAQLQAKIQDLALIYQQYEEQKAGLLDITDQFLLSCMGLKDKYNNQNLLFVGFDDFTAVEYTAIECLAYTNNVTVVNYFAKSNNQHIYNDEVASQLKNIAYTCTLPFETLNNAIANDNQYKTTNSTVKTETNKQTQQVQQIDVLKQYLQANIFGVRTSSFVDEQSAVKIKACRDVADELEQIARDIRLKVLNGAKYSQFGVAVFGLDAYTEQAKQIFDKYDINFYLDSPLKLNQSVLFKFVCDIFRREAENYELSHLIDIINSPFFVLDAQTKQQLILKLISIDFKGELNTKFDFSELNPARDALIDFLRAFTFENQTIGQIKQTFALGFEKFKFAEILQDISSQTLLFNKQILLNKSVETVMNLFEEIEKFYPTLSANQLADMFARLGEITEISNLPQTLDAVKIVDANNFCEEFDHLYIANCTADNAPAFKNDCGIIVDAEIEELNFAHKLAPTIGHINKLARLRVFNACLLFNKTLTISYSHTQSELIKEFCSRLQNTQGGAVFNLHPEYAFGGQYVALSKQDYVEKNLIFNTNLSSQYVQQKSIINLNKTNAEQIKIETISASRLEDYFKCPFHHFLNYTIKVQQRPKNEILPFDTGIILHKLLFNYYKANKKVGDLYEFAKQQIFSEVDANDRLKINAKSPVLVNLIDEAVRVLNGVNYIDQNSNFVPQKFEFSFKNNTALNLGNAYLTGQIDRVDSDGNNLRIVDYKTGKAEANLKELYYGNKLQLFLYALAMESASKQRVVGSFYLPLHNSYTAEENNYSLKGFFENTEQNVLNMDKRLTPGGKSDIVNISMTNDSLARKSDKALETDKLDMLKEYSKIVSATAIEEIKSGYINPTPTGVNPLCENCPYSQICLKNCRNIAERKPKQVTTKSFEGGEQ